MAELRERYSAFTLTVHWLTVALVLTQLLLLWVAHEADRDMRGFWMMGHKSVGMTILAVTLVRLGSRLGGHKAIPLPDITPKWQKLAARTTHVLFYVLLIAMPLAGWIASTAGGRPIVWFGLFTIPDFPFTPPDKGLADSIYEIHETAGKVLIGLVILHVLGGLKHYFVDRDNVLQRMLPFIPRRPA